MLLCSRYWDKLRITRDRIDFFPRDGYFLGMKRLNSKRILIVFTITVTIFFSTGTSTLFAGGRPEPGLSSLSFSQSGSSSEERDRQESLEQKIPFHSDVVKGTLDNGLTYYVRNNNKPQGRLFLRLVIDAGSILERDGQRGLAHFTEHMAFNGTKNFEKKELIDYLESLGMRFGPDVNAYTGFDETVYMIQVPVDEEGAVENAFQVIKDWARDISFDEEEIEKERGVIIEEWRQGRGAAARMRDSYFPILFKNSRYAERLPIGKMDVIKNFEPALLKDFYNTWYRPNLMAVMVVGDLGSRGLNGMENTIRQTFSSITLQETVKERPYYEVPDHNETYYALVQDPETPNTIVQILYKHDVKAQTTYGEYRRGMLIRLFNYMLNRRLMERTKEEDPPFLYGFAGMGRMVRTKSVFSLGAMTPEGGTLRGLEALSEEAERAFRFGFTQGELERGKKALLSAVEGAYKDRENTESISLAKEYTRNYLENEPVPGIEWEYRFYQKYLPQVNLKEVAKLGTSLITEENRVVLVMGPQKEGFKLPTEKECASVLKDVEDRKIQPYKEDDSQGALLHEKPVSSAVVKEKSYPEIGVTEWQLENGATVIVKSTDFKNDEILFSAFSPGGTSVVEKEEYISADLSPGLIEESGLNGFNALELERKLSGERVSLNSYISGLTEGFSGKAAPEDLEVLLSLLYLHFTDPREDRSAFRNYKNRLVELIKNRKSQPQTVFQDTLNALLSGDHYRSRPLNEERLKEFEFDKAYSLYRDRFSDASDFTFFFVGNLNLHILRPLVERYIGGLPSEQRKEQWRDLDIDPPQGILKETIEKGIEPKSRVAVVFHGERKWAREESFTLSALAEVLEIRLREVIREEEGGTYHVASQSSFSKYPQGSYFLSLSFSCDPSRVEELKSRLFSTLSSLKENGPNGTILEKVRAAFSRTLEENQRKNSYWLGELERAYLYDLSPESLLERKEFIQDLSVDTIKNAAAEYIHMDRYVELVLYPEKKEE